MTSQNLWRISDAASSASWPTASAALQSPLLPTRGTGAADTWHTFCRHVAQRCIKCNFGAFLCNTATPYMPHCSLIYATLPPHICHTATIYMPCHHIHATLPPHIYHTATTYMPHCHHIYATLPPHICYTAITYMPHCHHIYATLPPHMCFRVEEFSYTYTTRNCRAFWYSEMSEVYYQCMFTENFHFIVTLCLVDYTTE